MIDLNLEPAALPATNVVLGGSDQEKQQREEAVGPPAALVVAAPSPRRSPRIRSAYDGVRLGSVERATKRKVTASESGSGSGPSHRSSSSSSRRKKAKAVAVAGLLELPLLVTPTPLTRGKLKQIAESCDLNATTILDQARIRATTSAASSDTAASPLIAAPLHPLCVFSTIHMSRSLAVVA